MVTSSEIVEWFKGLQDDICKNLETLDGEGVFHEDKWDRPEGGGGRSRVIQGKHIEKGGVMFSAVDGKMPEAVAKGLGLPANEFLATGVSIVLHPHNPHVPIIHMNVRYFETSTGEWWFGGGIDVTPHYIDEQAAQEFHRKLKIACDPLGPAIYEEYKIWADNYFFNEHRKETRGIGGIFFDRLNESKGFRKEDIWTFVQRVGETFVPAYKELFQNGFEKPFTKTEQQWQYVRRGRYVEFNLVYDRGTKFGLQTNGRIESILMSMPPDASWPYNLAPASGSAEEATQGLLIKGIDWLN
ncbi:MAG: coproporphyrinogen III oxidase [Saprospiraceae bacterium]|jgi:coproporphyrinogen III oxidase